MKILIILLYVCKCVTMLEVVFESVEVEYFNHKYFNVFAYTLRRAGRRSPYVVNLYQETVEWLGNNVTLKWTAYEVISGRNILTPLSFEYRLCDFFYKDPYIGKMIAAQLPKNWICPFPPGIHNWTNIVMHLESAPFIPFTYSSLFVRLCVIIEAHLNKEQTNRVRAYAVVKQKLVDEKTKKKPGVG